MTQQHMINKPVLLIDGHNAIHRGKHVFKDLMNSSGNCIGAVWGLLGILKRAIKLYPGHVAILFFDGGRSIRRMKLLPSYKGHRKPEDDTADGFVPIYEQVDMAMELASAMGVHNVKVSGVEGDDLIAFISRNSKESVVYSNDRDFYQLVRPGCSQQVPTNKGQDDLVVTRSNFSSHAPCESPLEYLLYKCMVGDTSDGIKGVNLVGKVGGKTVIEAFRAKYGVLEDFDQLGDIIKKFKVFCGGHKTKPAQRVYNQWKEFDLSMKMISLWRDDIITAEQRLDLKKQLFSFVPLTDIVEIERLLTEWEFSDELQWLGYLEIMLARRRKILK